VAGSVVQWGMYAAGWALRAKTTLPVSVARVSSLRPVSGTAEEILGLLREWDAAEDPEPLVIVTSGSTGSPKRVMLSRDAMRASALATQERLGGPGQWVLNLPPSYVAGVQVLYRSVLAGTEPLFEELGSSPSGRAYISLVPTQLYRALEDGFDTRDLTRYDAVLIGGGPLSPEIRAEAEHVGIRIVQTYGMSETCGGCVYDGRPLDGVEVRIDDGEVQLRGPVLFDGYEGDPERTAAVMMGGWFRTSDLGRLDDDGRLWVTGRVDDVIISGGVKVPAPAVELMLEQHPDLAGAFVFGVPDEEWGQRVVALVVIDDWLPPLPELRDLVTPREWAPQQSIGIWDVPLLPNGKPDRLALRRMALDG
jgi:O-succinylbenzoic acid--CoA ligase